MKSRILNVFKSDGGLISIGTLLYGLQIFKYPHILENYAIYSIVNSILNHKVLGVWFIVSAMIKISGNMFDKANLRKVGMVSMGFLWGMFTVGFFISPPPNTVWTLSLTMVMILLRASIKEDG